MSTINASELLRPGLLGGASILIARSPAGIGESAPLGDLVRDACAELGARVCECELSVELHSSPDDGAMERAADDAVGKALAGGTSIDLLVVDCASLFARVAGSGENGSLDGEDRRASAREALRVCLELSWNATRALANAAFLPDSHGGRIVYLAPPPDAGEHSEAARAGLENLARTLSIEWARHRITPVVIAPGVASGGIGNASEVAALTAYLASPAGSYFSGCLLDLRALCRE
jgi:NAD(P)-dependent dehydrogenase (short-subunit alcohol dehydrogenase family)